MPKVKLIKYLDHLISEINIHAKDKEITNDELLRFSREFQKFRLLVKASRSLPQFLKDELLEIKFNYDLSKIRKRNFLFLLKLVFTGMYHVQINKIEHEKRASELFEVLGSLKRVYNKALYIKDIDDCFLR